MPELELGPDSPLQSNPKVYGAVAAVVGLLLIIFAIYQVYTWQQMETWPSTSGTITESRVRVRAEGDGKRNYSPAVKYVYQVNDKNYLGETVEPGQSLCLDTLCLDLRTSITTRSKTEGQAYAEQTTKKYAEGTTVTVYYDESNPDNSVLERDDLSPLTVGVGFTGLVLLILGLYPLLPE